MKLPTSTRLNSWRPMVDREEMGRLAAALAPDNKRAVVIVMREDGLSDASATVRLALRFAAAARKGALEKFAAKVEP